MNPVPLIPPAPVTPAASPTMVALRAGTSVRVLATTPPAARPRRVLTLVEMEAVASLPPELEWLGNLPSQRTRRAYRADVEDFRRFAGLPDTAAFRATARPLIIAWRRELERAGCAPATVRRKLSALSSLFDHLREVGVLAHNPVEGVGRPRMETAEGKTPAIGDHQARALLDAPCADTLKGKRDRAILAVLLYHGLRCGELCALRVRDLEGRRGVLHLRVHGKGGKTRYGPCTRRP